MTNQSMEQQLAEQLHSANVSLVDCNDEYARLISANRRYQSLLAAAAERQRVLMETLETLHPTLLGLLMEHWGPYENWPDRTQGKMVYDKVVASLRAVGALEP